MRTAIYGTGWGTNIQVPGFRLGGLEIVGLCSRRAEEVEKKCKELDIPFGSVNPAEVLKKDVQLVSIVTPPSLHKDQAIQALEAGVHVLCEKPFALNASHAREMVTCARAHPKQIAVVDHELRCLPFLQRAREHVLEGKIGAILSAQVSILGPLGLGTKWSWWNDSTQGGGLLGAVGSHMIDLVQFLTGFYVYSVSAVLETRNPHKIDPSSGETHVATANDLANVRLNLRPRSETKTEESSTGEGRQEFACAMHLNGVSKGFKEKVLLFVGTKGTLKVDLDKLSADFFGEQQADHTHLEFETHELFPASYPQQAFSLGTILMARQLIELNRRLTDLKRPREEQASSSSSARLCFPLASFEDGLQIQLVLDACYESGSKAGFSVNVMSALYV